jgi:hypothetical protein
MRVQHIQEEAMTEKTQTKLLVEALWPTAAIDREITWRFAAERFAGAATALELYSIPECINNMRKIADVCLERAEACFKEEMKRRLDLGMAILRENALVEGSDDS